MGQSHVVVALGMLDCFPMKEGRTLGVAIENAKEDSPEKTFSGIDETHLVSEAPLAVTLSALLASSNGGRCFAPIGS